MDFARKQLEKYGWTDGKGLGKHEDGISQALKPKLKRSVAGIGYDAAADFTEHWWSALYDKAAKNVEVEEKNGKTKKIKRKDDSEFQITNNTWKLKHNNNDKNTEEYSDFFVKTAVLDGGKSKNTKMNDIDNDVKVNDATTMTDEELFAACEGRTAHKGARHGLRALGKLARIEQQEHLLLQQAKYNDFIKNKQNIEDSIVEDASLDDIVEKSKKKKKRKRCNSFQTRNYVNNVELSENHDNIEVNEDSQTKKSKKSKHKEIDTELSNQNVSKKKKRKNSTEDNASKEILLDSEVQDESMTKKKKKKNKDKNNGDIELL